MINFFRKIRKKLADDNKPFKYLRYAVGEIVLVVVGILIALQINNWNEQQKLNIEEINFLKRIKNELVRDTIYFVTQIEEGDAMIYNGRKAVRKIYNIQNTHEEFTSVVSLFNPRTEELVVYNSAFQELKNSGKLNIIKNEVLRETIINHYNTYEYIALQLHDFNVYTRDLLVSSPFNTNLFKYYPMWKDHEMYKSINKFYKSDWDFINKPTSIEFRKLENVITQYIGKHLSAKDHFEGLKARTSLLIKKIDDELK